MVSLVSSEDMFDGLPTYACRTATERVETVRICERGSFSGNAELLVSILKGSTALDAEFL